MAGITEECAGRQTLQCTAGMRNGNSGVLQAYRHSPSDRQEEHLETKSAGTRFQDIAQIDGRTDSRLVSRFSDPDPSGPDGTRIRDGEKTGLESFSGAGPAGICGIYSELYEQCARRQGPAAFIQERLCGGIPHPADHRLYRRRGSGAACLFSVPQHRDHLVRADSRDDHGSCLLFRRFYTPAQCRVMSRVDAGIIAGICGGGKLRFTQRITEDCSCCKACFSGKDKRAPQ